MVNFLFAILFLISFKFSYSEDIPSYSIKKTEVVKDWNDPKYFESSIKQAKILKELKEDELNKNEQNKQEEDQDKSISNKLIKKKDEIENNFDNTSKVNSLKSEINTEKENVIKNQPTLKKKTEFLFNSSIIEDDNRYIKFENQDNYNIEANYKEELINNIVNDDIKLKNNTKRYNSLKIKKILNRILTKSNNIALQKKIIHRLQASINKDDFHLEDYNINKNHHISLNEKEDRFIQKNGITFDNLAHANDYINNYKYQIKQEIPMESKKEEKYNLNFPKNTKEIAFFSKKQDIVENSIDNTIKQKKSNEKNQSQQDILKNEIDIIPIRSQREFTKNQIIPPNLITDGEKNQHIAKPFYFKDYKKIAFEIIGKENSAKILESVYSNINNLDLLDEDGNTLLMHAIIKKDYSAISMLIQYGVNVDQKNKEGFGALHLAASYADINSLFMLLLKNPDLNIKDNKDNTPLMYLSAVSDLETIKQFIAKGPNLNEKNKFGWTALDFAKNNDNMKVYEHLSYLTNKEKK